MNDEINESIKALTEGAQALGNHYPVEGEFCAECGVDWPCKEWILRTLMLAVARAVGETQ